MHEQWTYISLTYPPGFLLKLKKDPPTYIWPTHGNCTLPYPYMMPIYTYYLITKHNFILTSIRSPFVRIFHLSLLVTSSDLTIQMLIAWPSFKGYRGTWWTLDCVHKLIEDLSFFDRPFQFKHPEIVSRALKLSWTLLVRIQPGKVAYPLRDLLLLGPSKETPPWVV